MSQQTARNPNSAMYWLSATRTVAGEYDDLHLPETRIVEFDFLESLPLLSGDPDPAGVPWEALDDAARDVGYPVFLRTDLTSAKHQGWDGVHVADQDELEAVVETVIETSAQKMHHPEAFLVREWLDIDGEFTAFGGLPIGMEFRVFATPDDHLCTHYYWPEESIRDTDWPEDLWKPARDRLEYARQPPWLGAAAQGAAFEAGFQHGIDDPDRAWSVDFARTEDGEWYLIDMALAEDSWHPEECEHAEAITDG